MVDMIDYLDELNAKRTNLTLYYRRFGKIRWLVPNIVKALFKELEEKWDYATTERARVLDVIWADPVMRQRMLQREKSAGEQAEQRIMQRDMLTASPGRPYVVSDVVKDIGKRVVAWEREDAKHRHHLDEALFYYKSGAWQHDGVEIKDLNKLIDDLTLEADHARLAHYRVIDGFQLRLRLETTEKHDPVSMISENVLKSLRAAVQPLERNQETPLSMFLEERRRLHERAYGVVKERNAGPAR